jgi:putative transcriptional regulator
MPSSVMSKLGRRLIASAKEARAIARGKADPATYRVHVPARVDVASIRKRAGLSQNCGTGVDAFMS